jgi:hypothetical protein
MESIFSQEQVDKIMSWKSALQTDNALSWKAIEDKAEAEIHNILEVSNFSKGSNLTEANIDQLFHLMRNFSANRALSNLLYKNNTIEVFNQKLRELFYGNEPFPKRVDDFFRLKGIGEQTLSQLLLALDIQKYPLITSQTKDAIGLDAQQEQKALQIATQKFQVGTSQNYLDSTLEYLTDFVVFERIKEFTNLEKYTSVNNMIWFANQKEIGEETIEQYTSVSLEKDLKEYLAKNPHILEKGLKLIEKEFQTKEIGNIDLLLSDSKGYDVVVELKKGKESDDVVGQISRYMGWVMKNKNKKTRGIIVVNEPDQRLEYSILPFNGSLKVKYYRVKFDLSDEYKADKPSSE